MTQVGWGVVYRASSKRSSYGVPRARYRSGKSDHPQRVRASGENFPEMIKKLPVLCLPNLNDSKSFYEPIIITKQFDEFKGSLNRIKLTF